MNPIKGIIPISKMLASQFTIIERLYDWPELIKSPQLVLLWRHNLIGVIVL